MTKLFLILAIAFQSLTGNTATDKITQQELEVLSCKVAERSAHNWTDNTYIPCVNVNDNTDTIALYDDGYIKAGDTLKVWIADDGISLEKYEKIESE